MEIPAAILGDIASLPARSVVAISGYGGAGKSTAASAIGEILDIPLVGVDAFIIDRTRADYRLWECMDFARLEREVIVPFLDGQPVRYHVFDWETNTACGVRELPAAERLLVEGVGLFRPELLRHFSRKIWVHCSLEVAGARGKKRDREVYHNPQDEAWDGVWKRNDEECFRAFRPLAVADHILNNDYFSPEVLG